MTDILALIGRAMLASLFIGSGVTKLMDPEGTLQYLGTLNLPTIVSPSATYYLAVLVELGGGLLLLLGVQARAIALILAVWCVATGVLGHAIPGGHANMVHFYKNISIAGGMLYVFAFGPGALAITGSRRPVARATS